MTSTSANGAAAPSLLKTGLVLGLLSTLGPLAIDLYLPAFPMVAHDLAASPAEVQRSLSIFFLALAAAQIPFGTLGDRFGRKRPLYAGLALFVIASAGCALAINAQSLILLRFIQGFGVCAGTAISRAMIRDLHTGHQAARLLAFSFLIIGISPVLAPVLGSALLMIGGWRMMFWLLAGLGLAGMLLAALALPESLPAERRIAPNIGAMLHSYSTLLGNPRFIAAAAAAGLATTVPYAFVTAAPFLFTRHFHLQPMQYSLLLGAAAICSIGTTQLSPRLMKHLGPKRLLMLITMAGPLVALLMAALSLTGLMPLALFQLLVMAMFGLVGLMLTPAAITALDAAQAAGAAAALLGTLQLVITALASALISLFAASTPVPLSLLLLGVFIIAHLCVRVAFRSR